MGENLNEALQTYGSEFIKVLLVNLTEDTYEIVSHSNKDVCFTPTDYTSISRWLYEFTEMGDVYPDDVDYFRRHTSLDYLRNHFRKNEMLRLQYRRHKRNEFTQILMTVLKSKNYRDDNELVYLYIQEIQEAHTSEMKEYEAAFANALSNIYTGVVMLDLQDWTVVRLTYVNSRLVRSGPEQWESFITRMLTYVNPKSHVGVLSILNKEMILNMEDNDHLSCDYEGYSSDENGFNRIFCTYVSVFSRDGKRFATLSTVDNTQTVRKERINNSVVTAIGGLYYSTFVINLKTREFTEVSTLPYLRERVKNVKDAQEALDLIGEEFTLQSHKQKIKDFNNLDTIEERLRGKTMVYCEVETRYVGWSKIVMIPTFWDEDGRLERLIFICRDINDEMADRKQQEAARRKYERAIEDAMRSANAANKAKSDFLANMSHDIRTPMNGILGMTAIAKNHLEDKDRVDESLDKINSAGKHLLNLINEVLDMSKIESGKLELHEEEFALSDLIDNLLDMIRPQILQKQQKLVVNKGHIEHENVIGDSLRIQQIFMNMMSNAVKYTQNGGQIIFSFEEIPTNRVRKCFVFTFEDNGMGMSEEFVKHIFEPFTRAKDSITNEIQGTGLGMSITQDLVNKMGGEIKVESILNEGSTFTVTLYLKAQDYEITSYKEFENRNVLVVDDDELSVETDIDMLDSLGIKAIGCASAKEGLRILEASKLAEKHKQFDAVIVDYRMPDMNGIEFIKEVRSKIDDKIPLILSSANDLSDVESKAIKVGATAILGKPIFKSRLIECFKEIFNINEIEQEEEVLDLCSLDLTGKRALVVEDNDINAEIAKEFLEMAMLDADIATDGKMAVDLVNDPKNRIYDIIFMDIQMPNMNGYDATRAIRAMDNDYCKSVPIVAMTANAFAEDITAAKSAGMNEHIAKPLDLEVLARVLKTYVVDN